MRSLGRECRERRVSELSLRIRSPTFPLDEGRDMDQAANWKGRKGGGSAVLNTAKGVRKEHKGATGFHITSVIGNLDKGRFNETPCKDTKMVLCFLVILSQPL